jgi:hypothetical protein
VISKPQIRSKGKALGDQANTSLAGFQIGPPNETRNRERLKLICPVLIEKSQGVMKTSLKELTLNGAFLTCPTPLPVAETFPVKIILEDREPLIFDAEVLWNNNNVSADKIIHRGMKVRFLQLSNDDQKLLNEIVSKHPPEDYSFQ